MLNGNERIVKHKIGLLNLAEELSNVSRACNIMGLSRDTFYRYRAAAGNGGIDALIDKSRRKPNIKNRVEEMTEAAVIAYAVEQPPGKRLQGLTGYRIFTLFDVPCSQTPGKRNQARHIVDFILISAFATTSSYQT